MIVYARGMPTADEVLHARIAAGLTQEQAAALVYLGSAVRWSEYERGTRPMPVERFELFLIKAGLHDAYKPVGPPR